MVWQIEAMAERRTKGLNLKATIDNNEVYKDVEYVIISTPINYDPK